MNSGQPIKNKGLEKEGSIIHGWLMVLSISLFFFLWGLLIYFSVGNNWPPPWQYGTVPDVPGQSAYSVQNAEEKAGTPFSSGEKIEMQHVMGDREKENRK